MKPGVTQEKRYRQALVRLDLLASFPDIGQNGRNAALGDGLDATGGDEQGHPALLFGYPEALAVQIGLEPPPGFAVGVADVVSVGDRLAGDNATASGEGGLGSSHLLCLPEKHMFPAEPAELLKLQPIRRVALVFGAGVAHFFAIRALE